MAMDTESDDSERWEDFFGSTTDLTPSLIGFYDTLTGNSKFDSSALSSPKSPAQLKSSQNYTISNEIKNSNVTKSIGKITTTTKSISPSTTINDTIQIETTNHLKNHTKSSHLYENELNYSNSSLASSTNSNSPPLKSNSNFIHSQKQYRSFKVLSPNVQRIISHSNTVVPTDNITKECCNSDPERASSPINCIRLTKKILGKHKTSCIPLSKNTCKLSQAGGTDGQQEQDQQQKQNEQRQQKTQQQQQPYQTKDIEIESSNATSVRNLINTFEFNATDSDKTPTNLTCNNFDFEPLYEPLKTIQLDCERRSQELQNQKLIKKQKNVTINLEPQPKTPTTIKSIGSTKVGVLKSPKNEILRKEMENSRHQSQITNDNKKNSRICKSPLQLRHSIKPNSPILTYARVKMLANKSSVQKFENSHPNDLLDSAAHLDTEGTTTTTTKTTTTTTTKSSIKNNRSDNNMSSTISTTSSSSSSAASTTSANHHHLRKMNSLLTDVANLKCRPLSSSSLSSTSSNTSNSTTGSTSSSTNDNHINGKSEVTSYLASVESLADHSEGELNSLSSSSHNTLSVLERSCLEIIDSERSYVEDLRQIIQGYLLDWQRRECLKSDAIKILFSNIQDIYEFNTELSARLMSSGMDQVKISKCFIDLNDGFDVYTTYCTSYPEAISLLTSLLQTSNTNALLTQTQKHLRHTLPLGSYLLKPVQRILRYHLLLDHVRKYCDNPEPAKAYEIMREVARNIDQVKKKLEQQNRVKELSGILDGWLGPELTVLGELRLEGLLLESGKPRMIFLFETMLIITKPKEDNRLQFKSYIYRNNLMLTEHLPGEPTSFNVIPYDEPRNLTKLTARNREQKKLWAQNIKSVIIENLDIPSRAKELVFKLGDEDDRTPDKISKKWSLNTSTPTPVYLERRNQYRRSEIRNRSKLKRKTVTNSSSFDALNNSNKSNLLSHNGSIDDNLMHSLSSDVRTLNLNNENQNDNSSNCNYDEFNSNSNINNCNHTNSIDFKHSNNDIRRTKSNYTKELKNLVPRSLSASRAESDEDFVTGHQAKSNKPVEVKMYNIKTIPKRIATIKKNRANKKETSTFYMDISEFSDTVLKITESSENLTEKIKENTKPENEIKIEEQQMKIEIECEEEPIKIDNNKLNEEIPTDESNETKTKKEKDAEIIEALIKESQDFKKILNKSPRKKSLDNGRPHIGSELRKYILTPPPPPLPRSSPPPLDTDKNLQTKRQISDPGPIEEPIYETLLRNVHVPYKFSPILNRSKSQQYYRPNKIKNQLIQRPESDYVTLVYSKTGSLENTSIKQIKFSDTLRNSDSSINYLTVTTKNENENENENEIENMKANESCDCSKKTEELDPNSPITNQPDVISKKVQKSFVQRLKPTNTETSFLPRMIKSVDNINQSYKKKPPERRVSDVTEMCRRHSIIHKQGGEALGERMAHQDYADPKTLFQTSLSTNSSAISLNNNNHHQNQRDSVFSLTSSSDSVSTATKTTTSLSTTPQNHQHNSYYNNDLKYKTNYNDEYSSNFNYEDSVENCLENDFRDSAIYSDDNNERRQDSFFDFIDTFNPNIKLSTTPSFQYKTRQLRKNLSDQINNEVNLNATNDINNPVNDAQINNCQLSSPTTQRILSPKPTALPRRQILCKSISNPINLANIIGNCEDDMKNNKSWVLQQIANFNK